MSNSSDYIFPVELCETLNLWKHWNVFARGIYCNSLLVLTGVCIMEIFLLLKRIQSGSIGFAAEWKIKSGNNSTVDRFIHSNYWVAKSEAAENWIEYGEWVEKMPIHNREAIITHENVRKLNKKNKNTNGTSIGELAGPGNSNYLFSTKCALNADLICSRH